MAHLRSASAAATAASAAARASAPSLASAASSSARLIYAPPSPAPTSSASAFFSTSAHASASHAQGHQQQQQQQQQSSIPTSKPVTSRNAAASGSGSGSGSGGAHVSRMSPRAPPMRQEPYSPVTVAVVKTLAKMMGYNTRESTAIRVTSDLYDACADAVELNAHFWHEECNLPRTYQTWFQLTNLHVWLLLVRFRALPSRDLAQAYAQEIINHFFIDAESRMRERFGVQTARLVKGYMRDMHMQQRGAVLGLDEAVGRNSDAFLAAALWRNIWGGGWGVVGGVKRKVRGIDRSDRPGNPKEYGPEEEDGLPDLAVDKGAPPLPASVANKPLHSNGPEDKLAVVPPPNNRAASLLPAAHGDIDALVFAEQLATTVDFVRVQVEKLAEIPDQDLMQGHVEKRASQLFTKIQ